MAICNSELVEQIADGTQTDIKIKQKELHDCLSEDEDNLDEDDSCSDVS